MRERSTSFSSNLRTKSLASGSLMLPSSLGGFCLNQVYCFDHFKKIELIGVVEGRLSNQEFKHDAAVGPEVDHPVIASFFELFGGEVALCPTDTMGLVKSDY